MRTSPLSLVLAATLLLAACTAPSATDTGLNAVIGTFDDATLATELWDEFQSEDGWSRPVGWPDVPVLSLDHVDAYIVRYDNEILSGWDGTGNAPEGAVSVLEEHEDAASATPLGIAAMKKVPGYDPGDWFWAQYTPEGATVMSGRLDACQGCHESAPVDYLYTEPPPGT